MRKSILFSSLVAASLMVGCTNEDFTEANQTGNAPMDRPVIDFSFGMETPDTRMTPGLGYDVNDLIGGVLVDYDQQEESGWFTVAAEGHVGNNRFAYDAASSKFVTDGTTVVGAWLFYSQYNKAMTTDRGGVRLDFPEVQMEANDFSEIAKIERRISPVVYLPGYEDGHFEDFNLPLRSIFSYVNINLEFPEAVDVQKIVIKPTDATYSKGTDNSEPFYSKYTINNQKVPVADYNNVTPLHTMQDELNAAASIQGSDYASASTITNYNDLLKGEENLNGAEVQDIVALNCLEDKAESKTFAAKMALPGGKYEALVVYAYTNKGVYKYEVKMSDMAADLETANGVHASVTAEDIYLLRQHNAYLHKLDAQGDGKGTPKGALVVTEKDIKQNSELEDLAETSGTVVISQEDLIAVIEGITTNDGVKIRVLGDAVYINQAVMAALEAKQAETGMSNVFLSFSQTDGAINVHGNETADGALKLHDITFNGGATLTEGYAVVGEDIVIPSQQTFTVNNGTTLTFAENDGEYKGVANWGTLIFDYDADETIEVAAIRSNHGEIIVNTPVKVATTFINNSDTQGTGKVVNNSTLEIAATTGNGGDNQGTIENNSVINITKDFASSGSIINGGEGANARINVEATMTNSGTITNNSGSIILAGGAEGSLDNTGTITNNGDMYCYQGDNTINNTGKIYANERSTTYITTNSSAIETSGTNNLAMGEIYCADRNVDVSVTTNTRKGYISWDVPADVETLTSEPGDKFNKVYLNGDCNVSDNVPVRYIVVEAEGVITLNKNIQEAVFNANADIYAAENLKVTIGELTVAKNVRIKVPTENLLGVYDVDNTDSKTTASIINNGTILVGGNFWTTIASPEDTEGEGLFASGDGNATAFHWGDAGNFGENSQQSAVIKP